MKPPPVLQPQDFLTKTIGAFVAEDYRSAAVFEKYGMDFCCGGQTTFAAACREKGLDTAAVYREVEAAKDTALDRSRNYGSWELPFLADYIINTHHAYLTQNTAQIAAYAHKIAEVHGAQHPEVRAIASQFDRIANEMAGHLREEEEVLFPAIKRIEAARKAGEVPTAKDRATIRTALATLRREHEAIGDATHEIRRLAKGYAIPDGVCNTFVVTYQKLQEFEEDLHQHVHLENNILFPKAALG